MNPFEQAQADVHLLARKPSNAVLLQLYALYKQATEGDVTGKRPGGFDFKGTAKYEAWEAQSGKSSELAQHDYVALVQTLKEQES